MEWRDEGIVVGVRRHGETSVLLELMTREHGRHLGLVRGGRSSRLQPVLQAGNGVEAVWRARLHDQLGTYTVEATRLRAAELMPSAAALYGLGHLGQLVRLLPERDPHPGLYEALEIVLGSFGELRAAAALIIRFELALLADLGVGLDLAACAVTGRREDLAYVSPKSGRAVSRQAAEPWLDRLLALPPFLHEGQGRAWPSRDDIARGFALTGHFLNRNVYEARGLPPPETRAAFIAAVLARDLEES
jgi:DNA repair protein RecO (recombination protein O)